MSVQSTSALQQLPDAICMQRFPMHALSVHGSASSEQSPAVLQHVGSTSL
jgi:hypothetical protein